MRGGGVCSWEDARREKVTSYEFPENPETAIPDRYIIEQKFLSSQVRSWFGDSQKSVVRGECGSRAVGSEKERKV
jgi:hypothetical protein